VPTYVYKCIDCSKEFEAKHSMKEKLQVCILCTSTGSVFIVPFGVHHSDRSKNENRPGQLVDKHIEDSRKQLAKEKKRLKSEEM